MSYKKSLLVMCKISKHFPNTLSADGKYSVLDRDNLTQRIQILLSRKQQTFSRFFTSFLKSSLNFEHFEKKDDPHSWCISEMNGLPKTWLDQGLKSPVSEHPSKNNMLNAPKHCSDLKDTSFTIFINHWESNCLTKSIC